jgi:hypothetical protein
MEVLHFESNAGNNGSVNEVSWHRPEGGYKGDFTPKSVGIAPSGNKSRPTVEHTSPNDGELSNSSLMRLGFASWINFSIKRNSAELSRN